MAKAMSTTPKITHSNPSTSQMNIWIGQEPSHSTLLMLGGLLRQETYPLSTTVDQKAGQKAKTLTPDSQISSIMEMKITKIAILRCHLSRLLTSKLALSFSPKFPTR